MKIRPIRYYFLLSLFLGLLSIILMFFSEIILWKFPKMVLLADYLKEVSKRTYLSFFVYPVSIFSLLYFLPRVYGGFTNEYKVKFLFIIFPLLELFDLLFWNTPAVYGIKTVECFLIFYFLIPALRIEKIKRSFPSLPSIAIVSSMPLLELFISPDLISILFSLWWLFVVLEISFEISFFYKTKDLKDLSLFLLSTTILLVFVTRLTRSLPIFLISLVFSTLFFITFVWNFRIEEISPKNPYKQSLFVVSVTVLLLPVLSYFDVTGIPTFLVLLVSIYNILFFSIMLDILPSINFSLYPVESGRNLILAYYYVSLLFFFLAVFFGEYYFELLLAGLTLSIISFGLGLREIIFLSPSL